MKRRTVNMSNPGKLLDSTGLRDSIFESPLEELKPNVATTDYGIKINEAKFKTDLLSKFCPNRNKNFYREKIKKFFDSFFNLTKSDLVKQPLLFVQTIEDVFACSVIDGEQIEWRELFIANLFIDRKSIKRDFLNDILKVKKIRKRKINKIIKYKINKII